MTCWNVIISNQERILNMTETARVKIRIDESKKGLLARTSQRFNLKGFRWYKFYSWIVWLWMCICNKQTHLIFYWIRDRNKKVRGTVQNTTNLPWHRQHISRIHFCGWHYSVSKIFECHQGRGVRYHSWGIPNVNTFYTKYFCLIIEQFIQCDRNDISTIPT